MSKFVFLNRSDKIIKINFELNYSRWKKELKSCFKETRFACTFSSDIRITR